MAQLRLKYQIEEMLPFQEETHFILSTAQGDSATIKFEEEGFIDCCKNLSHIKDDIVDKPINMKKLESIILKAFS